MSNMNSILQRLWDGLPTIQPLVASGAEESVRCGAPVPTSEATQLALCVFKACYANASADDCKLCVAKCFENDTTEIKSFSWLTSFIQDIVVKEWIDASILLAPSKDTVPAPAAAQLQGEDIVIPLTPLEEQLKSIVDCVLDDREPQVLLAFENVLTVPTKPKTLHDAFSTFVSIQHYPPFPGICYKMWNLLLANVATEDESNASKTIDLEAFIRWFTCFYRVQHSNATPARARVAAKTLWNEVLQSKLTSAMTLEDFISAAKTFARCYGSAEPQDVLSYLTSVVAFVSKFVEEGTSNFFDADIPSDAEGPFPKKTLADVNQVYEADDLDADRCEEAYFHQPTSNRIVVSGHNGVPQKGAVSRALATALNGVYVDVFEAAVSAVDAIESGGDESTPLSSIGSIIMNCVESGSAVPLDTRAKLVHHILTQAATMHRGYVFDDMPYLSSAHLGAYLEQCGFTTEEGVLPQQMIKMLCPPSVSKGLVAATIKEVNARRDLELAVRQEEQRSIDEKASAKALREEKRAARAARAELKARIEAGEIPPPEDDVPAEAAAEEEQEDLEEPPELDEDGNPMEPEAVAQRDALRAKERRRRILLEDIRHALDTDLDGDICDVFSLPVMEAAYEKCTQGHRVAEICVASTIPDATKFVTSYLGLTPSTVPIEIPLPEDTPENPDGSADNDVAIAEAKLRVVVESGRESFSRWRRLCPVTYAEHHVLVEGSMAFAVTYRGRVYCFTSPQRMRAFIASPHPYLTQSVTGVAPLLIMKRTLDVFQKTNLSAESLQKDLAASLGLTQHDFASFATTWGKQRVLEEARQHALTTRTSADAKQRVGRDERLKKRLEAEAKKKKKEGEKKKAPKKKEEDAGAEGTGEEGQAEGDAAQEAVIVETTADRLAKSISLEQTRLQSFCPLLVSTLSELNEALFTTLFDERVLPPTVIVLDYEEPRPEGEEDVAEEEVDDEGAEDADAPEELDEDGQPKPKAPKPPKVFDPTDDKQYRRLMKTLLAKLAASTESSGTDPEPAEEGKPAPKPYQSFNTITMNVFKKNEGELISDIILAVHPLAVNALPPQDGEDIIADPEPEDGDLRNPLLIPGPKAINQFGATLKYCPVALKEKGVLIVGDPTIWMSFKGKKYMFSTQEAMTAFKQNPALYADNVRASVAPRVWIVGVPFAGRRTLANRLSAQYNVPLFLMDDVWMERLIDATNSKEGGATVDGLFIPYSGNDNAYAKRAAAIAEELREFDKDQAARQVLKETVQREQSEREEKRDAGEDVEELDEEDEAEIQKAIEFELEEPEAREERVSKARRQIAAALTRIEPFESQGYLLVGRPNSEVEMQGLLDEGAYPDIAVHLKISSETFVSRQIDAELSKRKAQQEAKQQEVEEKRKSIQIKAREVELRKWRRRNIGADDAVEEEVEEAPEDTEPVTADAVRSDLEAQYEADNGNVSGVVGSLPDRRVPLVELNGDVGLEQIFMHATEHLSRVFLPARRSLFQAVQVCTFDEAVGFATSGLKMLSSFGLTDPVALSDERNGKPECLRMKIPGSAVLGEDEIPEIPPPPPKEKKFRTVTKTNDDGEEIEVQEEDREEEEEAAPEEPEPEDPPEPEPDMSPEELDEMRKEHEEKRQIAANKKKLKAAILGHRVFFFHDDATLLRFIQNPLKYWNQPPPLPPIRGAVVSVCEAVPRVAGEVKPRSMGEHLANNTGSVYVNMPKLLQWAILNSASLGSLSTEARNALVSGSSPSDNVVGELLRCRLTSADVQQRGAVLNNLPRSTAQVCTLLDSGLRISKCFTFSSDAGVLHDIVEAINARTCVAEEVAEEPYTMASLRQMVRSVKMSEKKQRTIVRTQRLGFPAPTFHTPLLETVLEANRSQYKWYCPYMWCRHQQLVEDPNNRRLVAEYLGKYFCFSSQEFFDEFMTHPESVSGESLTYGCGETQTEKLELPSVLPTHLAEEDARSIGGSIALELAGCCPVVLYDTRHHVGLRGVTEPTAVLGDAERFLVKYDGKFYALLNEEHTQRFLRQPWVFAKVAVLPAAEKLPYDPAELSTVPNELYAARTMREAAARAMLAVCRQRPKYPGLTLEESALKFMALYIKAHNPANSEIAAKQYQHNFERFATEATLYKTIKTEAPEDAEGQREFHQLCNAWDHVQDAPEGFRAYVHLQHDHVSSQ